MVALAPALDDAEAEGLPERDRLVERPRLDVDVVQPGAGQLDVREDAVQTLVHLVRQPGHHAVDHDHRGHAKRRQSYRLRHCRLLD